MKKQQFRHLSLPHFPKETYELLKELAEEMGEETGCNPEFKYAKWIMLTRFLQEQRDSGAFRRFARGE